MAEEGDSMRAHGIPVQRSLTLEELSSHFLKTGRAGFTVKEEVHLHTTRHVLPFVYDGPEGV